MNSMNYLHFDTTNMFLLIKWLPIETPFGLILGLALTSGVCICERIVTSRLEKVSMRLYQHQQQQQQQQELVWRQRRQRKHRSQVRSKARSSASATTVRTNSAEPDLISSEFEPQTAASGSRDSHRRPSLPPFPRPKVGDDDGEEGSSGNKISGKGLLVQKMTYYAIANMLRLSYMLLAMSFHIGVLTVIVSSMIPMTPMTPMIPMIPVAFYGDVCTIIRLRH
ncbi:hypothetical protein BC939DRAFT_311476 [Gamsiella multidivaricata]|uniref:uncharacterized protein n=1 Tax=Gamsiella multidivaricata TaxID=101098 RepID=UPI00221F34AC|nr:uncharacterized protein BC939DRAFT_311476 [Gamsiella multidivaricata]KAI7817911.1 hypothetical protein BC939DRAFT_311476 [Gamsiella multidivaricata]